jgi:outer membrane protein assembly factor BamB
VARRTTDELTEVELDEGQPAPRRRTPRAVSRGLAVVLVLVVLGVVVATRVQDGRHAVQLASLGFARSLAAPMSPAWHVDDAYPLADDGTNVILDGTGGLTAVDLASGASVWTADRHGCMPVVGGELSVGLIADASDASLLLWCNSGGTADAQGGGASATGAQDTVLDAHGTVVASWRTEGEPIVATVQGGDLIRAWAEPDGHLGAARWKLDGTQLWRYRSDTRIFRSGGNTAQIDGEYARIVGTEVVILDLVTGQRVDSVAQQYSVRTGPSRTLALPGGEVAKQIDGPGLFPQVEVDGPDGAARYSLSGAIARPVRDDGSLPDVLVVQSAGVLAGYRASTGDKLWTYTIGVSPQVLADGVLVAQGSSQVVALSVADGTVVWTHEQPPGGVWWTAITADRQRVASVEVDGSGPPALVARSLHDGTVRWRVGLPADMQWAATLSDGSIVVGEPSTVTVWR